MKVRHNLSSSHLTFDSAGCAVNMTWHFSLTPLCVALPVLLAATCTAASTTATETTETPLTTLPTGTKATLPPNVVKEIDAVQLTHEELYDAFIDHEAHLIRFFKEALNEVGNIVLPTLKEIQKMEGYNATVKQHSKEFIALWDEVDKVKLDGSNESLAELGDVFTKAIEHVERLSANKDKLTEKDDPLVYRLNTQQNFGQEVISLRERLLRVCDDFVARLVNAEPRLAADDRKFVNIFLKSYKEAKPNDIKWHDMEKILKVFLVEKERIIN